MGSGRALRIGPNFFGLRGTFVLSDPEALQATVSELEQAPVLTLFPQVGTYQLELCAQGSSNPACQAALPYELYRLECQDGSSAPELCAAQGLPLTQTLVSGAVLTTPNPQTVTIAASQATTTTFALIVPGEGTVAFARGTLNVDLDVTEGFPEGQACTSAVQCQSQVCAGTPPVCQAASCSDGIQNGGETGFDCGGPCTACLVQPNCADGQQNGDEEGVDCGGSIANRARYCPVARTLRRTAMRRASTAAGAPAQRANARPTPSARAAPASVAPVSDCSKALARAFVLSADSPCPPRSVIAIARLDWERASTLLPSFGVRRRSCSTSAWRFCER